MKNQTRKALNEVRAERTVKYKATHPPTPLNTGDPLPTGFETPTIQSEFPGLGALEIAHAKVRQMQIELETLRAIAEAAKPFLHLEQSRGHYADAFHISYDGGKTGIGQHLKRAFKRWEKVRKG